MRCDFNSNKTIAQAEQIYAISETICAFSSNLNNFDVLFAFTWDFQLVVFGSMNGKAL